MPTNFVRVQDIVIPDEMYNTIKIGNEKLDNMFSELGGLIPSQVMLLTGVPGAGKTSISALLGSMIATNAEGTTDRPVIFISREMSDFQLKLQARKIENFDKLLVIAEKGDYVDWLTDIASLDVLPALIIVDSLQQIAQDMGGSPMKNQQQLVKDLKDFAKDLFIPIIMIGHVTKDGRYMGPSGLKHAVDTHLHITINPDYPTERVLVIEKNRFGESFIDLPFSFGPNGGIVLGEASIFDVDAKSEARQSDIFVIDSDDTIEDTANKFRSYHDRMRAGEWDARVVKDFITRMIQYLENKYKEELVEHNPKMDRERIKIYWKGKSILANARKGEINFGIQTLSDIDDGTLSKYEKEIPFMERVCKNRYDKLMWITLHEFCHLFPNSQNHSLRFFATIMRIAKENSFLFTDKDVFQ